MSSDVHILGVRHHGPGSARSLRLALDAICPEVILLEGPPDAQELLTLAAHPEMRPPVSLLIYRPDEPKQAVFFPFAEFSPEWQAIQWAATHGVPVRFMDLPQRHRLALEAADPAKDAELDPPDDLRADPLRLVAEVAGYEDSERWWEERFEKRGSGVEAFQAVLELMTAVRDDRAKPPSLMEARREAWMRQTVREARRDGAARIAVVCGAWHGPALATMPTAREDAELLRGMPKVTVAATWLPWTHQRLTFASGYGAGVHSPGYYEHLWREQGDGNIAAKWMTRVAYLLRSEDLEGSTASVIEATRLAEAAAALRARNLPGLAEFNEAAQAVFCFGDQTPLGLIAERLIVGTHIGAVPLEAPQVPLQRDLHREQKRLRLAPEALEKVLEIDLRKPNDLARSHLLHRLGILGVPWGRRDRDRGTGTFRETWKLRWDPELEVTLMAAAPWGNTVAEAAAARAVDQAGRGANLPDLTNLLQTLLLAELPDAVAAIMRQLEARAALTSDVHHLMDALPPLVGVLRYGNVRRTDTAMVEHVVRALVPRICIGLAPACTSLSDEAAEEVVRRIDVVHAALSTLPDADLLEAWHGALVRLADGEHLHGTVAGRCCRLLLEDEVMPLSQVATHLSLALSSGNAPSAAAAWLQGFLRGSGLVLLHQRELWLSIDGWVASLAADHFLAVLPLLRRTFSEFSPAERRQMGEAARRDKAQTRDAAIPDNINEERANRVLPTIALLLGKDAHE